MNGLNRTPMENDFYFTDINPLARVDKDSPGSRDWYRLMHHIGGGAVDIIELDFLHDPVMAQRLAYRRNAGL